MLTYSFCMLYSLTMKTKLSHIFSKECFLALLLLLNLDSEFHLLIIVLINKIIKKQDFDMDYMS